VSAGSTSSEQAVAPAPDVTPTTTPEGAAGTSQGPT
jgi:hypothetical protein